MKTLLNLVLTVLCLITVQRFCHRKTDGFAISKILSSHPYREDWAVQNSVPDKEIQSILYQPYTYIGKGAQTYVFGSSDGKYVLKLFRHSHMRPPFYATWPVIRSFSQHGAKKTAKLEKDFKSYVIANSLMKEETGLVYLHLNPTSHLQTQISIQDKLGIAHTLEADSVDFLIQKRASLLYPQLKQWIHSGALDQAKSSISGLIQLLYHRAKKGILDKDPDLSTNFGFISGVPIQIDIGRFKNEKSNKTEEEIRNEIIRITDSLKYWLNDNSLELSSHLEKVLLELYPQGSCAETAQSSS